MSSDRKCLILFARYPVPGKVKTRLIPALGAEGAAGLHRLGEIVCGRPSIGALGETPKRANHTNMVNWV